MSRPNFLDHFIYSCLETKDPSNSHINDSKTSVSKTRGKMHSNMKQELVLILPIHCATLFDSFLLFLDISFSISTAKNTSDDTAQTPKNSYNVNSSVLNIGCKNGV